MRKIIKRSSKIRGLPPGSLIHIGEKKSEKVKISIVDYTSKNFEEREIKKIQECSKFKRKPTVSWINIDGLHDIEIIENIGKCFDIHPLALEDILNSDQRPKIEDFDEYILIILKMLYIENKTNEIKSEQVSIIFGKNFVLSFQEKSGDVFDPIRERIRKSKGKIRTRGADYLAYSLVDAIVDNYFSILESIGERVENIEEKLITEPQPDVLQKIYNLKIETIYIRKSIWPLRELINSLLRDESRLIKTNTHLYLRDLYDNTIQVIDTVETFRDTMSGMLDIYMSSVSNKMNEVMKVLTIFAAIFIPLTFIVGVYGMNFEYMPELSIQWAYPLVWLVIIFTSLSLLIYFKMKKWI